VEEEEEEDYDDYDDDEEEEDYDGDDIIRPTARNYAITWMFVFRNPWF
jgi:hypothetical protein